MKKNENIIERFGRLVGPAKRSYYNYLYKLYKAKKITDNEHTKLLQLGQEIQAATASFFSEEK